MHGVYRGQFTKLLQYIDQEFLPALGTSTDPDARAVYTRWVGGGTGCAALLAAMLPHLQCM